MRYRNLGRTGLKLSVLSLGSWGTQARPLDRRNSVSIIKAAYEAGINFFDNAERYGYGQSEVIMGQALKDLGLPRDRYCLSSKVFFGGQKPTQRGLSRKHIREACDGALRRLGVDYLDLLFCHFPDATTPIEETVGAMHQLVEAGKVLYWGTSNFSCQEITAAIEIAHRCNLTAPVMEQCKYNMLYREQLEREFLPLFKRYGYGTTVFSPLEGGILTGKYSSSIPENSRAHRISDMLTSQECKAQVRTTRELTAVAERVGCSMAQLALAWCLENQNVSSVIVGSVHPSQLEENLKALDVSLDEPTKLAIEDILGRCPSP